MNYNEKKPRHFLMMEKNELVEIVAVIKYLLIRTEHTMHWCLTHELPQVSLGTGHSVDKNVYRYTGGPTMEDHCSFSLLV